jgi:hypothetical protein
MRSHRRALSTLAVFALVTSETMGMAIDHDKTTLASLKHRLDVKISVRTMT